MLFVGAHCPATGPRIVRFCTNVDKVVHHRCSSLLMFLTVVHFSGPTGGTSGQNCYTLLTPGYPKLLHTFNTGTTSLGPQVGVLRDVIASLVGLERCYSFPGCSGGVWYMPPWVSWRGVYVSRISSQAVQCGIPQSRYPALYMPAATSGPGNPLLPTALRLFPTSSRCFIPLLTKGDSRDKTAGNR